MYERAELDGEWPLQCMAGSAQSLTKVDTPTCAGEFRPVTVLGLLYRIWSSHHSRHWVRALAPHLDENLSGNRPGHSPATVWRKILSAIDTSHRDNSVAAGFVVDLVKAYNTLPRYPVLFASKLLGVGQNTLMGWTGALSLIRRHFSIRGSYSDGLRSTTGLPEGCGLSCLAMLVLDALLHRWMDALHPSVSTYTFVDNWEILVSQETWLEPAFERLESFVRHLDLELDRRKAYFWSTSSSCRAQLRQSGRLVRGSARDLGAHVAYTRQLGNHVLTDRIHSLSSFWDRLLTSPGSHALKVKAIVTAAWPRAFHACSSAVVGRRHLDLVRTQVMKALKLQKPGASPWLQFASDMEGLDPVQWIISTLQGLFMKFCCNVSTSWGGEWCQKLMSRIPLGSLAYVLPPCSLFTSACNGHGLVLWLRRLLIDPLCKALQRLIVVLGSRVLCDAIWMGPVLPMTVLVFGVTMAPPLVCYVAFQIQLLTVYGSALALLVYVPRSLTSFLLMSRPFGKYCQFMVGLWLHLIGLIGCVPCSRFLPQCLLLSRPFQPIRLSICSLMGVVCGQINLAIV